MVQTTHGQLHTYVVQRAQIVSQHVLTHLYQIGIHKEAAVLGTLTMVRHMEEGVGVGVDHTFFTGNSMLSYTTTHWVTRNPGGTHTSKMSCKRVWQVQNLAVARFEYCRLGRHNQKCNTVIPDTYHPASTHNMLSSVFLPAVFTGIT